MPIKNYTTKVAAQRSIDETQRALVNHGAVGVLFQYELGRVSAMKFQLPVRGMVAAFSLPINWRAFQKVLKNDRVSRASDDDYCYRVAWRCVRDWVMAQLALYETQMVDLPQVFLPFAIAQNGSTLYEQISAGKFLLPEA